MRPAARRSVPATIPAFPLQPVGYSPSPTPAPPHPKGEQPIESPGRSVGSPRSSSRPVEIPQKREETAHQIPSEIRYSGRPSEVAWVASLVYGIMRSRIGERIFARGVPGCQTRRTWCGLASHLGRCDGSDREPGSVQEIPNPDSTGACFARTGRIVATILFDGFSVVSLGALTRSDPILPLGARLDTVWRPSLPALLPSP